MAIRAIRTMPTAVQILKHHRLLIPVHNVTLCLGAKWTQIRSPLQQRDTSSLSSLSNDTEDDNDGAPLCLLRQISSEFSKSDVDSSSSLHAPVKLHSIHNQPLIKSLSVGFGKAYRNLGPIKLNAPDACQRTSALRYLASKCGIEPCKVSEAVHLLEKAGERTNQNEVPPLAAYTRMQASCTSTYETMFRLLLQNNAVDGMKCLMEIREDLLRWIPCVASVDTEHAQLLDQLKQMDSHLQHLISTWMVPGLLQMRRLTYHDTSASILERIVRNEAVHPVSNLVDLRKRLGSGRRVFALFHPCLPNEPLFVLYVSLQGNIPRSMPQIHDIDQDNFVDCPSVAAFYSISSLRSGLAGIGLAEYLIHCAVKELQQTVPSVETFCTLSPLPTFRSWLMDRVSHSSNNTSLTESFPSPTSDMMTSLAAICGGDTQAPVSILRTALERLAAVGDTEQSPNGILSDTLEPWLMQCAAHYLVNEKHRKRPLDRVARFHVGNGAVLDCLHWKADMSRKGWKNSWGIMITYRYDLDKLSQNQATYQSNNYEIPLGSGVRGLLP